MHNLNIFKTSSDKYYVCIHCEIMNCFYWCTLFVSFLKCNHHSHNPQTPSYKCTTHFPAAQRWLHGSSWWSCSRPPPPTTTTTTTTTTAIIARMRYVIVTQHRAAPNTLQDASTKHNKRCEWTCEGGLPIYGASSARLGLGCQSCDCTCSMLPLLYAFATSK